MDDVLWAWNWLFKEICDKHAPLKKIKIRSKSAPWITNEIRRKMNYRYKLFKSAVATKDETAWTRYKKFRDEKGKRKQTSSVKKSNLRNSLQRIGRFSPMQQT